VPSKRYDDPRCTPEYIEGEKRRKRVYNIKTYVNRWWPRIEAEVKEERMHDEQER
jgi:hypothetical protein